MEEQKSESTGPNSTKRTGVGKLGKRIAFHWEERLTKEKGVSKSRGLKGGGGMESRYGRNYGGGRGEINKEGNYQRIA